MCSLSNSTEDPLVMWSCPHPLSDCPSATLINSQLDQLTECWSISYCCCDIWLASRELEAWLLPLLKRRQVSMFWTRESVKILHSLQSSHLLIPGNPYNSPDFVGNILERKVKISLFFLTSGRLFGLLERSFPLLLLWEGWISHLLSICKLEVHCCCPSPGGDDVAWFPPSYIQYQ